MCPPRASALSLALLCGMAVACDRADTPRSRDTALAPTPAEPVPADPADPWIPALGAMFVVPFDSQTGVVLFPETPTERLVSSGDLKLLQPGGGTANAGALLVASDSAVCGVAAIVRFRDSVTAPWSAALLSTGVAPLPMDSLESMASRDSSRIVAELARLASTLPMDPASRFKGLPFTVLSARRFEIRGELVVVGHLVRRVPHEAAPVEEHTLLVAERSPPGGAAPVTPLVAGFHLRSEGAEDTAEHYEALSAVANEAAAWLIIARYNDARTMYQVLERSSARRWRVRWSRALSC